MMVFSLNLLIRKMTAKERLFTIDNNDMLESDYSKCDKKRKKKRQKMRERETIETVSHLNFVCVCVCPAICLAKRIQMTTCTLLLLYTFFVCFFFDVFFFCSLFSDPIYASNTQVWS